MELGKYLTTSVQATHMVQISVVKRGLEKGGNTLYLQMWIKIFKEFSTIGEQSLYERVVSDGSVSSVNKSFSSIHLKIKISLRYNHRKF